MSDIAPNTPSPVDASLAIPGKDPIWRSPGFWIAAFFVLLITMNVIFFWIAGTNPVEFTNK